MKNSSSLNPVDLFLINISLVVLIASFNFLRMYGSKMAMPSFVVVCILFLSVLVIAGKMRLRSNKTLNAYIIFFIFSGLTYFYAINKTYVIEVALPMLANVVFMLCTFNYCRTYGNMIKFCNYFLAFAALLGLYNLTNFSLGSRNFEVGGVNTVPVLMITCIYLIFFLNLTKVIRLYSLSIYPFYIFIYLCTIFVSGSRKILLALVATFIIYLLLQIKSANLFRTLLKLIPIMIGLTIFSIFVSKNKIFEQSMDRITMATEAGVVEGNVNDVSGSKFRMFLIQRGIEYWQDSPVVGHGLNNYRPLSVKDTGLSTYSHNTIIELLVGMGVIGLVMYIMFYASLIRAINSIKRLIPVDVYCLLVASLLSYVIIGNFQQIYWDIYLSTYFMLIMSYIFIIKKNKTNSSDFAEKHIN